MDGEDSWTVLLHEEASSPYRQVWMISHLTWRLKNASNETPSGPLCGGMRLQANLKALLNFKCECDIIRTGARQLVFHWVVQEIPNWPLHRSNTPWGHCPLDPRMARVTVWPPHPDQSLHTMTVDDRQSNSQICETRPHELHHWRLVWFARPLRKWSNAKKANKKANQPVGPIANISHKVFGEQNKYHILWRLFWKKRSAHNQLQQLVSFGSPQKVMLLPPMSHCRVRIYK